MANVRTYVPFDMRESGVYYGEVEEAGSSKIVISDGVLTTVYRGQFYYNGWGEVFGRLDSAVTSYLERKTFEVTGINRDAYDFAYLLDWGTSDELYQFVLSGPDTIQGSSGADYFFTYGGRDTVHAGAGGDTVLSGWADDYVDGGAGNDLLDGGQGIDTLIGGWGNDTFHVDNAGDRIIEYAGQGSDLVVSSVSWSLVPSVERLTLTGNAAINGSGSGQANTILGNAGDNRINGNAGGDHLLGGSGADIVNGGGGHDTVEGNAGTDILQAAAGNDVLRGGADDDVLWGAAGNDALHGDWGRDILVGGVGADLLSGGTQGDIFRFLSAAEIGTGPHRDTITDFQRGDRIDVSRLDAVEALGGNQAFSFVGAARFSGAGGELRFVNQVLYGDTDGDGVPNFALTVEEIGSLVETDLIL